MHPLRGSAASLRDKHFLYRPYLADHHDDRSFEGLPWKEERSRFATVLIPRSVGTPAQSILKLLAQSGEGAGKVYSRL